MTPLETILARNRRCPGPDCRLAYGLSKDRLGFAAAGAAVATGVNDDDYSATFVISTSTQDRDGDVMVSRGCRLENYRKNPIWFFSHQEIKFPIGTAENPITKQLGITVEDNRVLATVWFDQGGKDAMEIFRLVKAGLLRATSVGFQPLEIEKISRAGKDLSGRRNSMLEGFLIRSWDLLEISIVGVPSNPEALRLLGKSFSQRLQKVFLPTPPRYPVMSKKWKKTKPLSGSKAACACATAKAVKQAPGEVGEPADEGAGTDVQALVLPKDKFPTQDEAAAWVADQGYVADTPSETETAWVFEQFPAADLVDGSAREEQVAEGVTATVGQRTTEAGADTGKDGMTESSGPDGGMAAEGEEEEEKADATDETPEASEEEAAEPPEEEAAEEQLPLGAQCLTEMREHIEAQLPMLEQPDVKKAYEKILAIVQAAGAKAYPDMDWGAPPEEESSGESEAGVDKESDVADSEDEETDEEEAKKKSAVARTKGVMSKRCKVRIKDAAEYLDDMSGREDMPKSYRAGHKYHANDLHGLCKELDRTPEANGDEEEEGTKFFVAPAAYVDWSEVALSVTSLQDEMYALTGRKRR